VDLCRQERNNLIIKDDGVGMTASDFQQKFLKIGYSKRKTGTIEIEKGGPLSVRKGIGKLALLSCADQIQSFRRPVERVYGRHH
jgi:HSP90 family molecular chaperone